jgi:hypothetical protein
MTSTAPAPIKPGHWNMDRQAGVVDHYPADESGNENLTANFEVAEDATPEIRLDGAADFRVLVGESVVFRSSAAQRETLKAELDAVSKAADGDSNDGEIESLREALGTALSMLGLSLEY